MGSIPVRVTKIGKAFSLADFLAVEKVCPAKAGQTFSPPVFPASGGENGEGFAP